MQRLGCRLRLVDQIISTLADPLYVNVIYRTAFIDMTWAAWWELAGHSTHQAAVHLGKKGLDKTFSSEGRWVLKNLAIRNIIQTWVRGMKSRHLIVEPPHGYLIYYLIFLPFPSSGKSRLICHVEIIARQNRQQERHTNKPESSGKSSRMDRLPNKQIVNALYWCLHRHTQKKSLHRHIKPSGHLLVISGGRTTLRMRGKKEEIHVTVL